MDDMEVLYSMAGPSRDGPRALIGNKYFNENFDRLLFGPGDPFSGGVVIKDCGFFSCSTASTFSVSQGVHMSSVAFSEIRAPDAMMVSSAAILENVVVRGGKDAAGLWCSPPFEGDVTEDVLGWSKAGMAGVDLAIDFSELHAPDSEVVGIPLSKLKWNPQMHIPVLTSCADSEGWAELDRPKKSFWRILLSRLRNLGCSEGIFTIPFPGDRDCDLKMAELARIEGAGLLKR